MKETLKTSWSYSGYSIFNSDCDVSRIPGIKVTEYMAVYKFFHYFSVGKW